MGMAIFPWELVGMGTEIYSGILQYSQKVGNSGKGNEIRGNGNSHDLVISAFKCLIAQNVPLFMLVLAYIRLRMANASYAN